MKIFGLETTGSFTGDISGSVTSTGSFGSVTIGTGAKSTFYGLTIQDDQTAGIALNDTGQGGPYQIAANGSVLYIRYNGENTRGIFLNSSGNVGIGGNSTGAKLEVAGNISGSATSTGSFGSLVVADKVQGALKLSNNLSFATPGSHQYILKGTGASLRLKHEGTSAGDDIIFELSDGGTQHLFDHDGSVTFGDDITVSGGDITLTNATPTIVAEQSAGAIRGKIKFPTSSGDGDITFETTTNGAGAITEQMRITHQGKVGIGTSSPTQRFHVSQSSGTAALIDGDGSGNDPILHVRDRADTFVALFEGNRAADTGAQIRLRHNPASPSSNNRTFMNFEMPDAGGTATTYAQLFSGIDDNTNTSEDGNFRISTMEDGTLTEQMRINSTGVGIGTDSPSGILDVRKDSGKVGFGTDSSADFGEIYFASGTAINFNHGTNANSGRHSAIPCKRAPR